MKRKIAFAFVVIALLAGCKDDTYPDRPEQVAAEAVKSNLLKNYDEAQQYITQSSLPQLEMMKKDRLPVDTVKGGGLKDMFFHPATIKGDSAFVRMYNRVTKMNTIFVLNKEQDKWKLNLSREAMLQTSRLTLEYYGITIEDLKSGKMTMDSAQKIMKEHAQKHPDEK